MNKCPDCNTPFIERELLGHKFYGQNCNCDFRSREDNEQYFRELVRQSNIPQKFQVGNIKDWLDLPGTGCIRAATRRYIQNIKDNYKNGVGLLFSGLRGTGKTKLQCYIGMMIMYYLRVQVRYISLTEMIVKLESIKKSYETFEKYIKKYIMSPVLIIDDVGESKVDEWNRKYIFMLLDARNNRKCVTLVNTMRDYQTQCDYIGEHNISRIQEMVDGNIFEVKSTVDMRIRTNREKYNDN